MDLVSAIGVTGGAIQITALITKTIHGLYTLHGKFTNADLTLNSLIAELLTIKAAITQLHELAQYNSNWTPKHPEYIEGLDVALDGCTAIVDVLSEEVAQLTPVSPDEEPIRGMGLRAKVKAVWKDDLMKEHSQMLHAQVLALQLLLQACHCRTSSEQLELLRRQENRDIFKKVMDDTATLRSTISIAGARTDEAASSIRGSCTGNTVFEFDEILLNEGPYRRAMRNYQLSIKRPAVLPKRQNSGSATVSRTDEGYDSATFGSRAPSLLLRKYLNPTSGEEGSAIPLSEPLQSHDDVSRRHTVSISRSHSSNTDKSLERSKSAAPALGQRSSGSTKERLLSALRRLNTTSRANLNLKPSPTTGSTKRRRNRAIESNISIDLTSIDSINTPQVVRAAQSGATVEVENFLKNGADIDARDATTGRTALAVAAHCNREDVVRLLIYYNAKVDTQDTQLSTPLHLAASKGHADVLQLLLEEDAECELKDAHGRTPFMVAANAGHTEAAKILLDNNCKVNTRATDQMTALHIAAKKGDHEIASLLLRYGIDIEAKDVNMMTSMHHACEEGHGAILEILINHKANIEAIGAHQMTPLICSAANGHFPTTELLLRRKVMLQSKDQHGMNALHWASFNGHTEIVSLLLQKKASLWSQNLQGRTALHLAAMNNQFALVEFLVRKKAPLEVRCHQGFTALHYACVTLQIDIVHLLLAAGADIEAPVYGDRHRPIHLAVSLGSLELTKFLCQSGACVDSPDSDSASEGMRALSIACRSGNLEIAQQLLQFGAQPRILFLGKEYEDSPICIASRMGHAPVVSLLLSNGSSAIEIDEMGWCPILYAAHHGHSQVLAILLQYYCPTADTHLFHALVGIGFSHDAPLSEEDKKRVQNLIQQVKEGQLSVNPSKLELPLQVAPTFSAIAPRVQPSSSRSPWEAQTISATLTCGTPVPLLPLRPSSPPIELPATVSHGHPDPRSKIQARSSQEICIPKSPTAWIQSPELPLSSSLSNSINRGAYLKSAFTRLTGLNNNRANVPSTPSTRDAGYTKYANKKDHFLHNMHTKAHCTSSTVPLPPGMITQSDNLRLDRSLQPSNKTESRERGQDDHVDNDKDDDNDSDYVCFSDTTSISTVFTALECLEPELDKRPQIHELEA
ncbi:hypothetical protein AJ78_01628 [Emergomyces pasteurianus Ep9510]|uniref:Uncharacterized protein n=1 Tax=Emergomyces pasteurianus Ep9510 TaxID=1447872 RepID=A0A1J9QDM5_9EURO|nr:hypothetical protein AJ78_01628 [Emergomyces pasteurianus Ep9510]